MTSKPRGWCRVLLGVAFCSLVAGLSTLGRTGPVEAADPPGVMVGWHEKGDDLEALRAHEAALGKRMAVVRLYQQWTMPGNKVDEVVAEGRLALVSHKPPPEIGWLRIALGLEDRVIRDLAAKYRSYEREIVFIFHHEPHDDALDLKGGDYGLSANYVAAYRRIHDIFAAEGAHVSTGGNVSFGYSATTPWILEGDPAGSEDALYPGDAYVDVLAHDRYNWASCRDDAWEEFSENWAPVVRMAAAQGKPLIIGEFGSPPADGRRDQWFRNAADWMKQDPDARRWLIGFAYFHSLHSKCPWDFMNQDDGRQGWIDAFSHDPHFLGTPFPLPRSGPGPDRLPVPLPLPIPLDLPLPDLPLPDLPLPELPLPDLHLPDLEFPDPEPERR